MAIQIVGTEYCPCLDEERKEFICDTTTDIDSLPMCCAGSMALVADAGKAYIVNASGQWVEFGGSEG